MVTLVEIVTSLDQNEDAHLARILLLLRAFQEADKPAIEGITKLAKLDFLLRYPSFFKRALSARGERPENIPVADIEEKTIEAKMVRYRFGPWDHRYRKFLNILVARGFVRVQAVGRTIQIDLTDKGAHFADELGKRDEFGRMVERATMLHRRLNLKARKLMEFIYEQFPELTSMQFNEDIDLTESST